MMRCCPWLGLLLLSAGESSADDSRLVGTAPSSIPLPTVEVPLPDNDASVAPPSRREPTGAVSAVNVAPHRGEAKDVAELVSAVPGTATQESGGMGQRKTISLRGAAPNSVLVLLDGVPVAGPGLGADLSSVPAFFLDRIEVLRGAGARYGPGGMGGVVDLISRVPEGEQLRGELSGGSFSTASIGVGAAAPLLGGDGLVLIHGLTSAGNFRSNASSHQGTLGSAPTWLHRVNNAAQQGGGLLRFRRRLFTGRLDVIAQGFAASRGLAGTQQNPTVDAKMETTTGAVSTRLNLPLLGGGEVAVLAAVRAGASQLEGGSFGANPLRQLESRAVAEVTLGKLVAGRHGLTALVAGGGDWLTAGAGQAHAQGRLGAMVGDDVLILNGLLTISGSARVDVEGADVVFSPKLGVSVELPQSLQIKMNLGRASRTPSFLERYVVQGTLLPNPSLRPESAWTADATLSWTKRLLSAAVTGFGAHYRDLISYEYYPPSLARPQNFSSAQAWGIEAEARVQPVAYLEASAAYTLLSTRNLVQDERFLGKPLPYRPQHRVSARVVFGAPILSARAELAAQSEQYENRTATVSLPGRAFVNVGVSSAPTVEPRVTVSLELKNLLDVRAQDIDGYPLPPRAAYLTLAVAWDAAKSRKSIP